MSRQRKKSPHSPRSPWRAGLDEEYVAWPTRVLMLRAELTELTQLIKERSNG